MPELNITSAAAPGAINIGGILTIKSNYQLMLEERQAAEAENQRPEIQALAAYIRRCFDMARQAREQTVEPRMFKSLRQRRGEYDPDKLAALIERGSSTIYMMLTSNKCRAASSWLRDVLVTTAEDKPWTIEPTPIPDLDPSMIPSLVQEGERRIMELYMQGVEVTEQMARQILMEIRDQALSMSRDMAERHAERMEDKMNDQLLEGGWAKAFAEFLDDLTTFPSAFLKGPVVRRRPRLKWVPGLNGQYTLEVQDELVLQWERVDPFSIYPAPDASSIDDGYLIERHRLSRGDLQSLIGVEGYSDEAIRAVLDEHGNGGLHQWLMVDMEKATAEGKAPMAVSENPSELIDALQFWGPVQGRMLREWGLSEEEVPDPLEEYNIEAWVIGRWVIKAEINPDPLGRKPYYKASYEEIPGAFWGNAVTDLCRDVQDICNAAARALADNMSMASGPQVVYNLDLLPDGEELTQIYPWKIWQVSADPSQQGSNQLMQFFQPKSMAQELMAIYDKFSILADEYTGIPRYMTGDPHVGGAGRTASGMSMLMSNAGKAIKQVISNIDENVIGPAIDRLYFYNMRYSEDPDLKGDVQVVARGATSLMVKEAALQRQQEFLALALSNPVAQQVIGMEGIAELMRQGAKRLDMNPDKVVPRVEVLRQRWAEMAAAQAAAAAQTAQANGQPQAGGSPRLPDGPGQTLATGAPVTALHPNNGVVTP